MEDSNTREKENGVKNSEDYVAPLKVEVEDLLDLTASIMEMNSENEVDRVDPKIEFYEREAERIKRKKRIEMGIPEEKLDLMEKQFRKNNRIEEVFGVETENRKMQNKLWEFTPPDDEKGITDLMPRPWNPDKIKKERIPVMYPGKSPFAYVGRVIVRNKEMRQIQSGTGILIADNVVLTWSTFFIGDLEPDQIEFCYHDQKIRRPAGLEKFYDDDDTENPVDQKKKNENNKNQEFIEDSDSDDDFKRNPGEDEEVGTYYPIEIPVGINKILTLDEFEFPRFKEEIEYEKTLKENAEKEKARKIEEENKIRIEKEKIEKEEKEIIDQREEKIRIQNERRKKKIEDDLIAREEKLRKAQDIVDRYTGILNGKLMENLRKQIETEENEEAKNRLISEVEECDKLKENDKERLERELELNKKIADEIKEEKDQEETEERERAMKKKKEFERLKKEKIEEFKAEQRMKRKRNDREIGKKILKMWEDEEKSKNQTEYDREKNLYLTAADRKRQKRNEQAEIRKKEEEFKIAELNKRKELQDEKKYFEDLTNKTNFDDEDSKKMNIYDKKGWKMVQKVNEFKHAVESHLEEKTAKQRERERKERLIKERQEILKSKRIKWDAQLKVRVEAFTRAAREVRNNINKRVPGFVILILKKGIGSWIKNKFETNGFDFFDGDFLEKFKSHYDFVEKLLEGKQIGKVVVKKFTRRKFDDKDYEHNIDQAQEGEIDDLKWDEEEAELKKARIRIKKDNKFQRNARKAEMKYEKAPLDYEEVTDEEDEGRKKIDTDYKKHYNEYYNKEEFSDSEEEKRKELKEKKMKEVKFEDYQKYRKERVKDPLKTYTKIKKLEAWDDGIVNTEVKDKENPDETEDYLIWEYKHNKITYKELFDNMQPEIYSIFKEEFYYYYDTFKDEVDIDPLNVFDTANMQSINERKRKSRSLWRIMKYFRPELTLIQMKFVQSMRDYKINDEIRYYLDFMFDMEDDEKSMKELENKEIDITDSCFRELFISRTNYKLTLVGFEVRDEYLHENDRVTKELLEMIGEKNLKEIKEKVTPPIGAELDQTNFNLLCDLNLKKDMINYEIEKSTKKEKFIDFMIEKCVGVVSAELYRDNFNLINDKIEKKERILNDTIERTTTEIGVELYQINFNKDSEKFDDKVTLMREVVSKLAAIIGVEMYKLKLSLLESKPDEKEEEQRAHEELKRDIVAEIFDRINTGIFVEMQTRLSLNFDGNENINEILEELIKIITPTIGVELFEYDLDVRQEKLDERFKILKLIVYYLCDYKNLEIVNTDFEAVYEELDDRERYLREIMDKIYPVIKNGFYETNIKLRDDRTERKKIIQTVVDKVTKYKHKISALLDHIDFNILYDRINDKDRYFGKGKDKVIINTTIRNWLLERKLRVGSFVNSFEQFQISKYVRCKLEKLFFWDSQAYTLKTTNMILSKPKINHEKYLPKVKFEVSKVEGDEKNIYNKKKKVYEKIVCSVVKYENDATYGQIGSPIFTRLFNGDYKLVGIHIGVLKADPEKYNLNKGVLICEAFERFNEIIHYYRDFKTDYTFKSFKLLDTTNYIKVYFPVNHYREKFNEFFKIASDYLNKNDYRNARKEYKKLLDMNEKKFGCEFRDTLVCNYNLGYLYLEKNKAGKALSNFEWAKKNTEEFLKYVVNMSEMDKSVRDQLLKKNVKKMVEILIDEAKCDRRNESRWLTEEEFNYFRKIHVEKEAAMKFEEKQKAKVPKPPLRPEYTFQDKIQDLEVPMHVEDKEGEVIKSRRRAARGDNKIRKMIVWSLVLRKNYEEASRKHVEDIVPILKLHLDLGYAIGLAGSGDYLRGMSAFTRLIDDLNKYSVTEKFKEYKDFFNKAYFNSYSHMAYMNYVHQRYRRAIEYYNIIIEKGDFDGVVPNKARVEHFAKCNMANCYGYLRDTTKFLALYEEVLKGFATHYQKTKTHESYIYPVEHLAEIIGNIREYYILIGDNLKADALNPIVSKLSLQKVFANQNMTRTDKTVDQIEKDMNDANVNKDLKKKLDATLDKAKFYHKKDFYFAEKLYLESYEIQKEIVKNNFSRENHHELKYILTLLGQCYFDHSFFDRAVNCMLRRDELQKEEDKFKQDLEDLARQKAKETVALTDKDEAGDKVVDSQVTKKAETKEEIGLDKIESVDGEKLEMISKTKKEFKEDDQSGEVNEDEQKEEPQEEEDDDKIHKSDLSDSFLTVSDDESNSNSSEDPGDNENEEKIEDKEEKQ